MTPPKPKMAASTPRLSEVARHFSYPDGIAKTVWPRVEAKGRELGIGFDWWQRQLGTVVLGYRSDGTYAASVGGVGMSIPRQVGKTYFVLAVLVIMCILYPGLQVVWTSHHGRTTTRTFRALRGLLKLKRVAPFVPSRGGVRMTNGEGQVAFTNGSLIMFGARQFGFGRGFEQIDIEVFDEAQILDAKALEDMVAATNQSQHEHGALLFFMGTPPRPLDHSEAFRLRRAEALSGEDEDAIWLELGADPKSDPDDRSQWPVMNPSYPKRTPLVSMLRLKKNLKDPDSWNREGRGVWDDEGVKMAFRAGDWTSCVGSHPDGMALSGLALAVPADQEYAAILGAGSDGENVYVKVLDHAPDTFWVAECLKRHQDRHGLDVVVDPRSPATSLIPLLKREGVRLHETTSEDVFNACGTLDRLVRERRLRHEDDPVLNRGVEQGKRRESVGRWAWKRPFGVDTSALDAATFAAWRAAQPVTVDLPPAPRRTTPTKRRHPMATAGF